MNSLLLWDHDIGRSHLNRIGLPVDNDVVASALMLHARMLLTGVPNGPLMIVDVVHLSPDVIGSLYSIYL